MTLRVPDVVASAAAACGAGWWLRDLPRLDADLEAEWCVSVQRTYPHATEAFVAEASLGDGTPAVLKLLIPHDGAAARHEITMLRLAGGRGCVRLLRQDDARGALLLERLGSSLYELGRPLAERPAVWHWFIITCSRRCSDVVEMCGMSITTRMVAPTGHG